MPQNPQKTDEPSGNPTTNEYNTAHRYYTQHSNQHYKTYPTRNEQQNKANPTTRHHYQQYTYHATRTQTHQKQAAKFPKHRPDEHANPTYEPWHKADDKHHDNATRTTASYAYPSCPSTSDVYRSSIDKWFDRFYREDTVRNHDRGDGYGIGLSIAKAVVTDMNGSIDATLSRDGHTLSMTIRIPLAREDMPQRRFPWDTANSTTRRHGTKTLGSERYRHHRHEHGTSDDTKDGTQNAKTGETDGMNVENVSSSTQDTESTDDGVHK